MNFAFLFVAFSKPGINWVIHAMEEIKWNRKVAAEDKDRAERERRADRLAESETRSKRNLEVESRRRGIHVVPKVAMAVAAAGIPGIAAAESPRFPIEETAKVGAESADAEAHAAHGWKGPRDQAAWNRFQEAVRRGMTNQKEIAEAVGIPTTTAHRWWNVMHANANAPQAANA
jgi:hypothetical protein